MIRSRVHYGGMLEVSGGYNVYPAPVPKYIKFLRIRRVKEGRNNQNLILFIRG